MQEIGLLTELFYGTIQRKLTLDFYLKPFIENKRKWNYGLLSLLRMTVYQMAYLDRVPDRAAIYEAVQIAKKRGHQEVQNSSMVFLEMCNVQDSMEFLPLKMTVNA